MRGKLSDPSCIKLLQEVAGLKQLESDTYGEIDISRINKCLISSKHVVYLGLYERYIGVLGIKTDQRSKEDIFWCLKQNQAFNPT